MINILIYISTGFILFAFISYLIMIMIGSKKTITKSNGFDITKDMISEYNRINIIESKNYFTIYNIKRKVIKLSTKCYYGNDLSSICISLIEAGISVVDNQKNKFIDLSKNIVSNLKILYLFPLIAIMINYVTYNFSDAKVSTIFIILFSIITYMMIDIKNHSVNWIIENIEKTEHIEQKNKLVVVNFINKLIVFDKFIFLGELIMIIRMIAILLEFS